MVELSEDDEVCRLKKLRQKRRDQVEAEEHGRDGLPKGERTPVLSRPRSDAIAEADYD